MLLKKKFSSQTLFRIAMSVLLAFFVLALVARFAPARTPFWDDIVDGVRGMMLGVFFGLMVLVFRTKRLAR
ncbi:MAG TPA: hypothetical protein VKH19_20100 [Gemmatimonadaceae bacterium]|nr:hypothetical protein [Gemmatimonadaceae bacterium]